MIQKYTQQYSDGIVTFINDNKIKQSQIVSIVYNNSQCLYCLFYYTN